MPLFKERWKTYLLISKIKNVLIYLDDIIVCSTSIENHIEDVRSVFETCRKANLKIKLNKCQFFKDRIKYLGYMVDVNGVSPDPDKVDAIVNANRPFNKKELETLLGMISYYRQFIANLSEKEHKLRAVLTNHKWNWGEEQEEAFIKIKNDLANAVSLAYPSENLRFIVDGDASDHGLGCVLSQVNFQNNEVVIQFASRALKIHNKNYSTT
ncbi:Retrovirus-related Pol polyprotein from transposon 17.6 [Thelohanellus kitauei]|uniref:Retrovirus-related Pol polyprotein from transposon 17.6 n=1 Tax=Thelohanellus kitauei TaxID=669202 RepID=A0A0C2MN81_THEKT|nr:Retrovirus-related Pol polyprotein from transposon 17.6 [Thelohanellus kitauei]